MSDRYDPNDLFDEESDETEDSPPAPRLPADIFRDPFEDEEEEEAREVFLPSILGGDVPPASPSSGEDDDERPFFPGFGARDDEPVPMRERLARAVQRLGENEQERRASAFAGADVSAPSLIDKLRRRREPTSVPPLGQRDGPDEPLTLDDPFARLLTPLAGPQLSQLQQEVAADEVVFLRYERSRQANLQRQGMGVVFAIVMLLLFFVFAGQGYLEQELVEANVPDWLSSRLGEEHAGAAVFIVGLILPFLSIGVLADTFVHTLKALTERSFIDLCLAIVSASFAAAVLLLLVEALPLQAATVLVAWFLFRLLVGFVRR